MKMTDYLTTIALSYSYKLSKMKKWPFANLIGYYRFLVALLKLKDILIVVKQHKTVGFPINQSIRYTFLYVGTYFLHSVHVYFKALFLFPNVHNSFLRVLFSTIFKSTFLYALFSSSIL